MVSPEIDLLTANWIDWNGASGLVPRPPASTPDGATYRVAGTSRSSSHSADSRVRRGVLRAGRGRVRDHQRLGIGVYLAVGRREGPPGARSVTTAGRPAARGRLSWDPPVRVTRRKLAKPG